MLIIKWIILILIFVFLFLVCKPLVAWIKSLVSYRDLLYMIMWRDIKIKYKQSIMGVLWAIFMPVIIICAGITVRLAMASFSEKPLEMQDILSVSIKSLPWAFFVSSIRFSSNSLINNNNLITKIYFPRDIFPIAAVLSQLFDFVIASCVLIIFFMFLNITVTINYLWIPIILLVLIVLSLAIGIFLSAANLFLRDVKYIVEILLTFGIFFTPVFYEAQIAGKWIWVIMINPVAPLLESLNNAVVHNTIPDINWLLYSVVVSLALIGLSVRFFKSLEPKFAESI